MESTTASAQRRHDHPQAGPHILETLRRAGAHVSIIRGNVDNVPERERDDRLHARRPAQDEGHRNDGTGRPP